MHFPKLKRESIIYLAIEFRGNINIADCDVKYEIILFYERPTIVQKC